MKVDPFPNGVGAPDGGLPVFPPTDDDQDGIPDGLEDYLAERFAPVLRLPPPDKEQNNPSSVDWYLERVHMRFDHPRCFDHEIIALGSVTQQNLSTQQHQQTNLICSHSGSMLTSDKRRPEFFLQPPDDKTHKGADPSEWRAYVHARRSSVLDRGYDVQFWFFWPYQDWVASFNHEGDWEHITVSIDEKGALQKVWYAQHGGGAEIALGDVIWVDQTHPTVFTADGSHASYVKAGKFTPFPGLDDHTYDTGPVWDTRTQLVNVGEIDKPSAGQDFIRYGGRWGEIGELDQTSGPLTPSVQDAWDSR